MNVQRLSPVAFSAALLLTLAACGGGGDEAAPTAPSYPALELTLAHVNDHHSNLDAFTGVELQIGGQPTQVELGGFARLTQAFKAYAGRDNVLKLHAGDAMTGTMYYTLFQGAADAAVMNTVCFDAFVPGNHEFDDGDSRLKAFVDALHQGSCKTPVLSANVKPAIGSPLAPKAVDDVLKPYVIQTVRGVPVGIIGLTISGKTMNSSRPLSSTVFEEERTAAQRTIDALKAKGVRHIVLLTHQGLEADKQLAARLSDVDAIIGGDSHTLLGDFAAYGLTSAGSYPVQVMNQDNRPVCIGQAWEYSKAIGEMRLRFNAAGELTECGGQASLLVGDTFKRKNAAGSYVAVDASTQQQILAQLASDPRVKSVAPDAQATALIKTYADQVALKKAEPLAQVSEALCLVRVPGESGNRSAGVAGCEAANTLARGSDAAQVVAEAFLAAALRADVAVQNAGGVRIAVPAGQASMNTAFQLLPFSNVLVELPMTGVQLVQALEDAVSNHLDAGQSNGSHPYAAGLRWDLDLSKPKGQRFSNVQVRDRVTGVWSAIDPARSYRVATNDFIAEGKDGYATFGNVFKTGVATNTYLLYTESFVAYARAKGTLGRPDRADYAHQTVITKAGLRLP